MNKKQEKIEREKTERSKRRDAETSEAMRKTPRGSEKRMKRERRGAEGSEGMRRAASDSENREMMRGISKKLRKNSEETQKKSEES